MREWCFVEEKQYLNNHQLVNLCRFLHKNESKSVFETKSNVAD
jgi:hypothetical protein